MTLILIIIFIVVLIYYIYLNKTNYKITFDFITFFEGGEGSGKTTILTYLGLAERLKRVIQNKFIKIRNTLLFFLKKKPYANTKIYSNYPVWINKKEGFSYVITNEVLTWEKIVEEGSIILLDEMGLFFPLEQKKTEQKKIFTMTFLRHILDKDLNGNNARIFASSQSMSEVNITFRRKCNKCYELSGCRKARLNPLGNAKVNIMEVYLSESITNSKIDNSIKNVFTFRYPKGHFSSTYGKQLKYIKGNALEKVSESYAELLKYFNYKFGDKWRELDIKL